RRERANLLPRIFDTYARPQPTDHDGAARPQIDPIDGVDDERQPQPHAGRESETRWHDADDGVAAAVEHQLLTNDAVIGAKALLPESVTQDCYRSRTGFCILCLKTPAEQRRHPKDIKEFGGSELHVQTFGLAAPRERHRRAVHEGADLECLASLPKLDE